MKPLKLLLTIFALMFVSQVFNCLFAQVAQNKLSLEKGTIANRFDYVIRESTVSDDSRIVKTWWLTRLKTHVSDTIKDLHLQILASKQLISTKNAQIDSLAIALQEVKSILSAMEKEKNSVSLLGAMVSKRLYNGIMWSVVLILGVVLLSFYVLFKRSNIITKQTKLSIDDLRAEYEAHRKTAREREEKLSFNYHRELNKLKEKKI